MNKYTDVQIQVLVLVFFLSSSSTTNEWPITLEDDFFFNLFYLFTKENEMVHILSLCPWYESSCQVRNEGGSQIIFF